MGTFCFDVVLGLDEAFDVLVVTRSPSFTVLDAARVCLSHAYRRLLHKSVRVMDDPLHTKRAVILVFSEELCHRRPRLISDLQKLVRVEKSDPSVPRAEPGMAFVVQVVLHTDGTSFGGEVAERDRRVRDEEVFGVI